MSKQTKSAPRPDKSKGHNPAPPPKERGNAGQNPTPPPSKPKK